MPGPSPPVIANKPNVNAPFSMVLHVCGKSKLLCLGQDGCVHALQQSPSALTRPFR